MRVLFNGLCTLGQRTGVGNYAAHLLAALPGVLTRAEAVETFPGPVVRFLYAAYQRWLPGGGVPTTPAPVPTTSAPKQPWWRSLLQNARACARGYLPRAFARRVRRGGLELYHEPNAIPYEVDLPTVVTVHDLSVLLYPQWHPAARVAHYEKAFTAGLGRCAHILTDTEAVRREIIGHLGVAPERVTAVHLGVQPELRPVAPDVVAARLRALQLPANYLLAVGTLEPRKNQLMLVRAYCRLPVSVRERYPLLLVGGLGWNNDDLRACLDGAGKRAGVARLGYVPDGDLAALYSGARALLFPSYYEGFGFPPLEMQACGGAVVASTAAAVAEVCAGSPAQLLDPHDADAWYASLLRVCTDDDFHRSLCTGATSAAGRFTWQHCAERTLGVYRHVAHAHTVPIRKAG